MDDRERGLVIYISSGSSTQPTPMCSSYAAGKRLLDNLAQNLQQEYPKITFQEQTQRLFWVSTHFKMISLNQGPWSHHVCGYKNLISLKKSIKPYFVATKMTHNNLQMERFGKLHGKIWKDFTILIPSPRAFVSQSLGTVNRHSSTHGYAPQCFQSWIFKLLPDFVIGPFLLQELTNQRDAPQQ